MVRTYTKPTSGAELISGIVGTVDVGNIITKVIEYTHEEKYTQDALNQILSLIDAQDGGYTRIVRELARADFGQVYPKAAEYLRTAMRAQAQLLRNQVLLSALGYGASATMTSMYAKLRAQFEGLSVLYDAVMGVPLEFLMDNATRWWNSQLTPNPPKLDEALRLVRWGRMSRAEWTKLKVESDGVKEDVADKIFDTLYKQLDEFQLWKLLKRKVIDETKFYDLMARLGYDKDTIALFIRAAEYVPSFYDLTRLADYVPLDDIYIGEVLRANGIREADIPRLTTYLQRRPLREEVRNVLSRLLFEYSRGRLGKEAMLAEMDGLGVLPEEKKLYSKWADLQRKDYILDLQIDIIEQQTRKGLFEELEEVTDALVKIGLDWEIANLLATKFWWTYRVS
jgi:hypothetical protein